jgi:hypothetical protein
MELPKLTNSVVQEPEGSSLHSQYLATSPYPEPVKSNPPPPPKPISLRSTLIPFSHLSERSLSFGLSHQNLLHFSLLSHESMGLPNYIITLLNTCMKFIHINKSYHSFHNIHLRKKSILHINLI